MTAEQILEKHLLLMLKRTDESYVSIDEMKQQPEWQATINAMLEYGEMQVLRIHNVEEHEQLSCGRNITTCVFYKDGGKCSNPEYCRDQTT